MKIKNNRIINKLLYLYRKKKCDERDHIELGYEGYCELKNQEANDFILKELSKGNPCMISKFGTVELSNITSRYILSTTGLTHEVLHDFLHFGNVEISPWGWLRVLCSNAGFFPLNYKFGMQWYRMMIEDIQQIDILGSYVYEEKYLKNYLHCTRVNLNGYYAPYMWKNPWTKYLEGKKVLIIHPFVESIKRQYEKNRTKLFSDSNVLPEFKELITIKAVQTQASAKDNRFKTWFEALQYMKDEMDKLDYDVALIGCGAYGMCLAAHAKRCGKQAVHLASMTQMLFGVYGNRWVKQQPEFMKYINDSWIRPNQNETPKGAERIEGGCYW